VCSAQPNGSGCKKYVVSKMSTTKAKVLFRRIQVPSCGEQRRRRPPVPSRRHVTALQGSFIGTGKCNTTTKNTLFTHLLGGSSLGIALLLGFCSSSSSSTLAFCLCLNDPVLLQLGHARTRHHVTCLCLCHLAEVFDGYHALFAELHGEYNARFLQADFEQYKGISKRLQFRSNGRR